MVGSVVIGARRLEPLEHNLAATRLALTHAEREALDEASALPREYPGWMFETRSVRASLLSRADRSSIR